MKIKQTIKQGLIIFFLINLALTLFAGPVLAQEQNTEEPKAGGTEDYPGQASAIDEGAIYEDHLLPGGTALTPYEMLKSLGIEDETGLNMFEHGQHPDAPPDYAQPGVGMLTSPVFFAIDLFRYAISAIALLIIIYSALKLIASGKDEEWDNTKRMLIMGIIGFIVIQLANTLVKDIFFGEQGDAFDDIVSAELYAKEGEKLFRGIIGVIQVFLASIAVLVIVIRGFAVILSAGNEEDLTKAKNQIIYAVVGLLIIGLSELVVKGFIFPDQGSRMPDVRTGREIIVMLTNFISGFIAIFAFVTLFYGGYRYVVSAGNDEASELVKKILMAAVIALVLALGAFAAVNTFIDIATP